MHWGTSLLQTTRLRRYPTCLQMLQAYAEIAPWWERLGLAAYCGLGTWLGEFFGVNTSAIWASGETIVSDMFAASRMTPPMVAEHVRTYVRFRLENRLPLSCEQAYLAIYNQPFYPLVQHLNFAIQPSAFARRKFVEAAAMSIDAEHAFVADLGCGPGVMLCDILSVKPGWMGFGLDISPTAIHYAERLAAHKGLNERSQFRMGNIAALPYPSESVDLVLASEVLEHVPLVERAIREIARVLRPRGKAAITLPIDSITPAHAHSFNGAENIRQLCEKACLRVLQVETRQERIGYGDDPGHVFLLAEVCPNRRASFTPRAVQNDLSHDSWRLSRA